MKNLSIDLKHNFLFIYTSRHYDTESYEKKKEKPFITLIFIQDMSAL